jgi:hypothetical protein
LVIMLFEIRHVVTCLLHYGVVLIFFEAHNNLVLDEHQNWIFTNLISGKTTWGWANYRRFSSTIAMANGGRKC